MLALLQNLVFYIFQLVGLGAVLKSLVKMIYELFIMKEKPLLERYGKNSWAVITGATDGIGQGFANQLAKRGFNIMLISRTESKLQDRQKELQASYPTIQVKYLVKDFSRYVEIDFYSQISKELKGQDISILVNNVGIAIYKSSSRNETLEEIRNCSVINTVPQTMMTQQMLKKFEERKKSKQVGQMTGAIIDMSSITAIQSPPGQEYYAATKRFNRFLTQTIGNVFAGNQLDFLSVKPYLVATNMIGDLKKTPGTVSVDDCVVGSLRALGNVKETFGAKKHVVIGFFCEFLELLGLLRVFKQMYRKKMSKKDVRKTKGEVEGKVVNEDKKDK